MARKIDYGNLMHRAMRGLITEVLRDIEKNGLPGDHHFFITFDTRHEDARLADWLKDRYPQDMTIVMQHWYDGLKVDPAGFAITLNFGDQPEPLYIPFDAVRTFVDPSVEFGLRFETHDSDDDEDDEEDDDDGAPMESDVEPDEVPARKDAEVVSLDKWRK